MSPCSRLLRCFRPPRSSSSVARSMPFWPGGTGQARCGFGARWFSSSTCLRLHARGTGQLVSPLCGSQCVLRVPAHGVIRGEGAMFSRGSGFGTGAGRSCHPGSLLSRPGIGMLGWTPTWTSSCCSPTVPRTLPKILCPPICGSSSRRFLGILTSCPCKHFNLKFSIICDTGSCMGSPHGLWSNPFRAPLPDLEHLPRHLEALHPKIRAHRALRGWLGSSINGESEFPPACCGCGDPTYRQCLGCIKGVRSACFPVLQICPVCRELSSSDDDSG